MFLSNLLGTNTPNPSEQASGGKSGMGFKFLVFSILTALSLWGAPTTTCGSDNTATDNAESILASEAPTIQAEFADNNLVLTFTGNLESSADGINWIAIETPSPYTVKPTGKKRLFRAVSAGQKTKIIEIEISDESVKHRDEIFAASDILGKSDEELLKRFVENSLPKLLARTEQKFPTVKTKNKLEKQTSEFGDVYTLTGDKDDCIIYYIHGGAWVSEIDKLHVEFCDKLVDALDAKVYMPIYPLAPQATYKEGYQMIESVYDDLLKLNKPIFIMGDSAGGNIALNFVSQLKEKGKPLPEKIVVMAPCADMSFSNPEIKEYAKVDGELPRVECLACAELWADGTDLKDPILSPLYADVTGFPDTMFIQGTYDILYPDTMALFDKMCASGVNTTFIKGIGFWHVFPVSNIKEQQQTIDLITAFCPVRNNP